MKNILVPTDFSVFAHYAYRAALNLARKFGATVHLFHSANLPKDWNEKSDLSDKKIKKNIKINEIAREKLEILKKESLPYEVELKISISGGKFLENVIQIVDKAQIDLIVMGSHGVSGKKEYFIGSNAQKLIRSIHVPVLTLKNPIADIHFDKVIFASGFAEKDKATFKKFLSFIMPFAPELHLLAINTSSFFSQPSIILYEVMDDFMEMSTPLPCYKHFYNDINIEAGIRHFSDQIEAKLIAISNHERHPIKRMFQGSNVEMLVNHSSLPILTIDYK